MNKLPPITIMQAIEWEILSCWWLDLVNNDLARVFISRKRLRDHFINKVKRRYEWYEYGRKFEEQQVALDEAMKILNG